MTSDIEQARAARAAKLEAQQTREAVQIARAYVEQLGPDVQGAVETTALMIAIICVGDAFDIPRETMLEAFASLTKGLSYPAAVIE